MKTIKLTLGSGPFLLNKEVVDPKTTASSYLARVSLHELVKAFSTFSDDIFRPNPRLAKLTGNDAVAGMEETLLTSPNQFINRNSGMVINADKISWAPTAPTEISLVFNEDSDVYDTIPSGIANGGTTFRKAKLFYDSGLSLKDAEVLVRFNINFPSDWHASIARGLNTSKQVKWWPCALMDGVMDGLLDQMFTKSKNRKKFELLFNTKDDNNKEHDPTEMIRLLNLFDVANYGYAEWESADTDCETGRVHPIKAATNAGYVTKAYNDNDFKYLFSVLDCLVFLDTAVRQELDAIASKKDLYDVSEKQNLTFDGTTIKHTFSAPYIYPLLSAFRVVLDLNNKKTPWAGFATSQDWWNANKAAITKVIKNYANKVHKLGETEGLNRASRDLTLWDYPIKQLKAAKVL